MRKRRLTRLSNNVTMARQTKKIIDIEVVEENDERVVITVDTDGEIKRMLVDSKKPTRTPRRPYARAWSEKLDRTRKKRF